MNIGSPSDSDQNDSNDDGRIEENIDCWNARLVVV